MARKHKLEDDIEFPTIKKAKKTSIPGPMAPEQPETSPDLKEQAPPSKDTSEAEPSPEPTPVPASTISQAQPELQPSPIDILAPHLAHLTQKYSFARVSIKSSSKISSKVTTLIQHMSRFNFLDKDCRPGIVVLDARSSDASKMLSVVEITKRELMATERSGKWYQYSRLGSELTRIPRGVSKVGKMDAEVGRQGQSPDGNGRGDVSFGSEDTKLRAVPLLMVYMARLSIPELKLEYGEQTNEGEFAKKS